MKVLFDNCTPPVYATTLDGYVSAFGHRAFHIKDVPGLPNGRHATDIEWISFLREQPEDWAFMTGDGRVLRNPAERAALRSAGLHGFVLAPAFQKTPFHQAAATIVWKWPEIAVLAPGYDIAFPPWPMALHRPDIGLAAWKRKRFASAGPWITVANDRCRRKAD